MRKGRLDIINTCKYLMVIALIAYVVLLVSGEGDNTVSVDTIQKNIEKSVSCSFFLFILCMGKSIYTGIIDFIYFI